MNTVISVVLLIIMFVIMLGVITLLKKFVFPKVRINKYIPLGIAVVGLVVQFWGRSTNIYINVGLMILIVTFFSWYLDINQTGGPKKTGKKIVIKSKAKPNRIKNTK